MESISNISNVTSNHNKPDFKQRDNMSNKTTNYTQPSIPQPSLNSADKKQIKAVESLTSDYAKLLKATQQLNQLEVKPSSDKTQALIDQIRNNHHQRALLTQMKIKEIED